MKYFLMIFICIHLVACNPETLPFVPRKDLNNCENKLSALQGKAEHLEECIYQTEFKYWSYIRLNGHKIKNNSQGDVWRAPSHIWDHAEATKRNAIEECRILYK